MEHVTRSKTWTGFKASPRLNTNEYDDNQSQWHYECKWLKVLDVKQFGRCVVIWYFEQRCI